MKKNKTKTRPPMKYEDIEIGEVYEIHYVDANYPCHCDCHRPGSTKLHIVACCYDQSYYGPAIAMIKNDEFKQVTFKPGIDLEEKTRWFYVLDETGIIRKLSNDN